MTDSGSGYQSALFNDWPEAAGIERKRTGPHGPWQNGRVERMNRTSAQERRYARAYAIEGEGPHGACGSPPTSRVIGEKRYGTQQLHPPRGCSLEGVSGWVRGTFYFLNDPFPTKWRTSNCSNKFVWTAVIFGRAEKGLEGGAARTIPIACLAFHVSCAGVPRRRPGRPT